jgi:hypothetical protein
MRAVYWALSAIVAVGAAQSAARAQFPGPTNPWQGRPGMPGVNGGLNPFGQGQFGLPSGNSLGPFGQPRPGLPGRTDFFPGQHPLGAFGGNPLDPRQLGGPIPSIRAPTAWDIINNPRNGLPGGPWGPNVAPGNFGRAPQIPPQAPQVPPDVLRNIQLPQVTIPKFDLNVPPSRPAPPSKGLKVPSWVRWEWVVGLFAISLVGGMVSGYLRRRRSCG